MDMYDQAIAAGIELLNNASGFRTNWRELRYFPIYRDTLRPLKIMANGIITDEDSPEEFRSHCIEFIETLNKYEEMYDDLPDWLGDDGEFDFERFLKIYDLEPTDMVTSASTETLVEIHNNLGDILILEEDVNLYFLLNDPKVEAKTDGQKCYRAVAAELTKRGINIFNEDGGLLEVVTL